MSKVLKEKSIWLTEDIDRSLMIASHFGFAPIEPPKISKQDIEIAEEYGRHPYYDATESSALIRSYIEHGLSREPHPLSISYKRVSPGKSRDRYSLHFIGSTQGVVEATLIRSSLSILNDLGHKNLSVDMNSVGDKDSLCAYERELHQYIRKLAPDLPDNIRENIKKDIFSIFELDYPEIETIRQNIPPSISSLTSASRIHLKEVLEYIEALNIEFRLTPSLVGNKNYCSNTIFAIRDEDEKDRILAVGYHYSKLTRRLGLRKEIPMVGVTITSDLAGGGTSKRVYKTLPKSKFCLVHLGRDAKMRTLSILEDLRREHIHVYHLLGKDKITVQLTNLENLPVSHVILIGQKEALDGTATVRNVATRAQDTIALRELPLYLKNLVV